MKNNKKKAIVGQRHPLVEKLLIVDGIGRAGKYLLASLLSGIKGIEPVQYRTALEHIPRLRRFNFIAEKAAREFLRAEIDQGCYEMLIGRSINHRRLDKSSIFNNPRCKEYLKRQRLKIGHIGTILTNFYKNNLFSLFIVHETLPNIKIFLDTFPKIKIISIQRSPVDLVYSWYHWHQRKTKIGQRFHVGPLVEEILLRGTKGNIPWYLHNHEKEYNSLLGINRVILSITVLFEMYKSAYKKLPAQDKKKILFVRYEDILLNPQSVTKTMAKFLKKEMLLEMKQIIKKEKLPNKKYFDLKKDKIKKIKNLSSEKYFKKLLSLENECFDK